MSLLSNQYQIIEELLSTEHNYVRDLQDVCEVYLPCFGVLHGLTSEDVNMVFSNIEDILQLSRTILSDLVAADHDSIKIAETFLDRASDFHQYTSYCTSYHRANERLFELKRSTPLLATILADLQRSLGHPLPLSSYLHKPVQRVLKYHLILKNLLQHVDVEDESRPYLMEAYESMARCAEKINNSKRLTEMDVKTRELHELLLAIRETDHFGKLLREGEMTLADTSTTSCTVFIYMFENVLVLCKRTNAGFALHTILRCSELLIIEDNSRREMEFSLVPFSTPSQALTLRAKTLAQKLDWCIQLDKLTDHNIPNKAKKLLLSNNDSAKKGGTTSGKEKQPRRRPSLPLWSPTSLGRRVRRRLTSTVSEVMTRSKSSVNLRRSSSTTSGGSSLLKNYDSAFESMSLKSDISYSSDKLSSIGSQVSASAASSNKLELRQQSHDDSSPRVAELNESLMKGETTSWHHLLVSRLHRHGKPSHQDTAHSHTVAMLRAQSCIELTTPSKADKDIHSTSSRGSSVREKMADTESAEYPAIKRNLFESKGQFLKKVMRWKQRAHKHRVRLPEKATPAELSASSPVLDDDSSRAEPVPVADSTTLFEHDNMVADDCTFKLDISQNFSDCLIESLNAVLQMGAVKPVT